MAKRGGGAGRHHVCIEQNVQFSEAKGRCLSRRPGRNERTAGGCPWVNSASGDFWQVEASDKGPRASSVGGRAASVGHWMGTSVDFALVVRLFQAKRKKPYLLTGGDALLYCACTRDACLTCYKQGLVSLRRARARMAVKVLRLERSTIALQQYDTTS